MKDFPKFMKNEENHINSDQQKFKDIDGYYFEGKDGSQMAFVNFYSDAFSKVHKHEFDEYVVCVYGQFTVVMNGEEVALNVGDELVISKGTLHGEICIPGTRTIHAFGGKTI